MRQPAKSSHEQFHESPPSGCALRGGHPPRRHPTLLNPHCYPRTNLLRWFFFRTCLLGLLPGGRTCSRCFHIVLGGRVLAEAGRRRTWTAPIHFRFRSGIPIIFRFARAARRGRTTTFRRRCGTALTFGIRITSTLPAAARDRHQATQRQRDAPEISNVLRVHRREGHAYCSGGREAVPLNFPPHASPDQFCHGRRVPYSSAPARAIELGTMLHR